MAVLSLWVAAPVVGAQTAPLICLPASPPGDDGCVQGNENVAPPPVPGVVNPPEVLGESVTRGNSSGTTRPSGALPVTGADIAQLTGLGLCVVGLGLVALVVGRRRRAADPYRR